MTFSSLNDLVILACPMCMSGAEGKIVMAANSAIALLFTVHVGVLASFFAFILYLARRAKRFADLPEEA